MKISSNVLKKLITSLFAAVLGIFASSAAHAQILYIDDSNPEATIITASNMQGVDSGSYDISIGVDLVKFFSSDTGQNNNFLIVGTSGLTTGTSPTGPTFNQVAPDDINHTRGETELSLWNNDGGSISFSSGSAAFSGSITVDLTKLADGSASGLDLSKLPTLGTMNDVIAGSTLGGPGTIVGEWIVGAPPISAPEPSTWALLVGSVLLLPWLRRFRRV